MMADFPGEKQKVAWEEMWDQDRAGFHKVKVDERLKKYIGDLTGGKPDASVLVTWCGKSLDVPWLCSQGYCTTGIELSETGVRQLFKENGIPFTALKQCDFVTYTATDRSLKVFVGNFYKATPDIVGTYDSIWDINALGAAEREDRSAYVSILVSLLAPGGHVLLSNYEFNDQGRERAPYSLSTEEIKCLFDSQFDVKFLEHPDEFVEYFMKKYKVDWVQHNVHLLTLK